VYNIVANIRIYLYSALLNMVISLYVSYKGGISYLPLSVSEEGLFPVELIAWFS
jgi:hypothetical protein